MKHIWKIKGVIFVKKEKNAVKLQKVIFFKSLKLLTEKLHERPPIQNIQVLWYIGLNPWLWIKGFRVRFPSMPGTFVLQQGT